MDVLEWGVASGAAVSSRVANAAAAGGFVHALEWVTRHFDATEAQLVSMLCQSASKGHVRALEWLHDHGGEAVSGNETLVYSAVHKGAPVCVVAWFDQNGYVVGKDVAHAAAWAGTAGIIPYLILRGEEVDLSVANVAVEQAHAAVLLELVACGAPIRVDACLGVAQQRLKRFGSNGEHPKWAEAYRKIVRALRSHPNAA